MKAETSSASGAALTRFNIFVVLLIPLVWTFEASSIGPALGRIAETFSLASDLQIKLVMTMPFITAIIFSAVSGMLARYIDRKTILIIGLVIYGVTGMMPAWLNDINSILVVRLLTGIGVGLVSPIPNAIITERFEGEKMRRLLGMTSSISMVANVIASLVSGMLLAYGWQYPFYTFAIVFVIALLALAGTPAALPQRAASTGGIRNLPPAVFALFAFMTLNFAIQAIITTSVAMFMTADHIGEPWMIGIVISFPGLACFVLSPFYPEALRVLKSLLIPVSFLLYALGYYVLAGAHTPTIVSLGAFIVGAGNAMLTPHILAMASGRITLDQHDAAYGVITAGIGAGVVASPFFQSLASAIGGSGAPRFLYLVATGTAIVIAVVSFAVSRSTHRVVAHD
ncbi:MFS transporter [Pararobbsia silviterrae]|uniref:MFS transporter n=1 Tax=Pararobbsia silviterrae TaxID=1792498 RepID=A0A494Y139_9BURK|nr:MFS transporter [Pararobbsia silviterrae]RKP53575.1 MFS transporter [Pararobbsia silviterrae]